MSETKTPDVCPKCGAGEAEWAYERSLVFDCASVKWNCGKFDQSETCRIRELEQENARLKEELEAEDCSHADEIAAHQDTLRLWNEAKAALAAERERVAKAVEVCVKEIEEQHKSHVAWECDSDETICTIRRHFAEFDNSSGPG